MWAATQTNSCKLASGLISVGFPMSTSWRHSLEGSTCISNTYFFLIALNLLPHTRSAYQCSCYRTSRSLLLTLLFQHTHEFIIFFSPGISPKLRTLCFYKACPIPWSFLPPIAVPLALPSDKGRAGCVKLCCTVLQQSPAFHPFPSPLPGQLLPCVKPNTELKLRCTM